MPRPAICLRSSGINGERVREAGERTAAIARRLAPGCPERLEAAGLRVSGTSPDERLVEVIELAEHPFFVASQFHPEFKSRPQRPAPLFRAFIEASLERGAERAAEAAPAPDEQDAALAGEGSAARMQEQ